MFLEYVLRSELKITPKNGDSLYVSMESLQSVDFKMMILATMATGPGATENNPRRLRQSDANRSRNRASFRGKEAARRFGLMADSRKEVLELIELVHGS